MIIRNMETHSASVFKCNDWFSKTEGKLVKEIPAETDGEEMLKSKLFSALFNGKRTVCWCQIFGKLFYESFW